MAVRDPDHLLGLRVPSVAEKHAELARALYIEGRPALRGSLPVRARDASLLRVLGQLFAAGARQPTVEEEYLRLTGNLKRVGQIARALGRLGLPGRLVVRLAMGVMANVIVRQGLFGVRGGSDVRQAALGYFTIADRLGFQMEVHRVADERVEFTFSCCPGGFTAGECVKTCLAMNKFDRQCVRALGARMVLEELIPEGAPACKGYIVPVGERVPGSWRRCARGRA